MKCRIDKPISSLHPRDKLISSPMKFWETPIRTSRHIGSHKFESANISGATNLDQPLPYARLTCYSEVRHQFGPADISGATNSDWSTTNSDRLTYRKSQIQTGRQIETTPKPTRLWYHLMGPNEPNKTCNRFIDLF